MTEPMSTPDSGGLREAIKRGLRKCRIDDPAPISLIREDDLLHVTHMVEVEVRALLAAHPEPVPTPESAEPVERACDSDFGYPGTSVHRAHEWDAEVQERAGARWTSETFRCPGVAPDSADDATVGERKGCGAVSPGEDWVPGVWEAHDHLCVTHARDEHECACGARWDATPDADDTLPPAAGDVESEREVGGRLVREVWIAWAREQSNPKASWLVEWSGLSEPDREVDRRIAERLFAARDAAWAEKYAAVEGERDHWKAHAEEAGQGFERVCLDYARVSAARRAAEAERDTARREAGERIAQAIEALSVLDDDMRRRDAETMRSRAALIARADALTFDDGSGA